MNRKYLLTLARALGMARIDALQAGMIMGALVPRSWRKTRKAITNAYIAAYRANDI